MTWIAMLCIISVRIIFLDFTQRRIKNHDVLIFMSCGAIIVISGYSPFEFSLFQAIAAGFLAFATFLPFYIKGWMGAGDVKLAAALGVWLGFELLLPVWILSVLMALVYAKLAGWDLLKRWLLPVDIGAGTSLSHRKFVPYGAMLCLSALLVGVQRII